MIEVDKEKMILERESEILVVRDDYGIIFLVLLKFNFEFRIKNKGFFFNLN